MKEVAWIFGNSAAGKETFVHRVTDEHDVALLERLGWAGKKIVASNASIKHIGQYEGDPVTRMRDNILAEVPGLLEDAEVALIKWQGVDSGAERPQRLKLALPAAEHRIIQILTPDEELCERLLYKSWWNDGDPEAFAVEEHERIARCIDQLEGQFPITKISGQAGAEYALID